MEVRAGPVNTAKHITECNMYIFIYGIYCIEEWGGVWCGFVRVHHGDKNTLVGLSGDRCATTFSFVLITLGK